VPFLILTECEQCGNTFAGRRCPKCGWVYERAGASGCGSGFSIRSLIVGRDCRRIVKPLKERGSLTTTEIAKELGVSNPKALTRLSRLVREDVVEMVGKVKKAYLWAIKRP